MMLGGGYRNSGSEIVGTLSDVLRSVYVFSGRQESVLPTDSNGCLFPLVRNNFVNQQNNHILATQVSCTSSIRY
jgi:hypothetical protein